MPLFISIIIAVTAVGCTKADVESTGISDVPDVSDLESSSELASGEEIVLPTSFFIEGDNYFDYQSGLECSAFASAYVLRHNGEEADGVKLFETFPNRLATGGAMPSGIEVFFDERGYNVQYKQNGTIEQIKELLCKGAPVIVFVHVSEPYSSEHNTHYVPVVGYDEENFYFAESLAYLANCKDEQDVVYNRKTDYDKFLKLWSNIDGYWENPYFVIEKNA